MNKTLIPRLKSVPDCQSVLHACWRVRVSAMSPRYAKAFPELIDKGSPKLLIVIGWFVGAGWIIISDQSSGRLVSIDDLLFLIAKIGLLSVVSGPAMVLGWLFSGGRSQ